MVPVFIERFSIHLNITIVILNVIIIRIIAIPARLGHTPRGRSHI